MQCSVMWGTLYLKPRLLRDFAVHLPAWSGRSEDCVQSFREVDAPHLGEEQGSVSKAPCGKL